MIVGVNNLLKLIGKTGLIPGDEFWIVGQTANHRFYGVHRIGIERNLMLRSNFGNEYWLRCLI